METGSRLDLGPSECRWPNSLHIHRLPCSSFSPSTSGSRKQSQSGSLYKVRAPARGPALATALLHSVHALSIPVRMGVDYVSRSQMFFWSCQHSICALECGIFVWKWLGEIGATSKETQITGKSLFAIVRKVRCMITRPQSRRARS